MVTQVRRPTGLETDSLARPSRGCRTTRRPCCTALQDERSLNCRMRCPTPPSASGTCCRYATSRRSGATHRRPARGPVRRVLPARHACLTCSLTLARPTTWPENTCPSALSCTRPSSTIGAFWCRSPTGRSIRQEIRPGTTTRGPVGCTNDHPIDSFHTRYTRVPIKKYHFVPS